MNICMMFQKKILGAFFEKPLKTFLWLLEVGKQNFNHKISEKRIFSGQRSEYTQ